jgi:1-acyl-sn-glycerol-3-phosphate acyltransferase
MMARLRRAYLVTVYYASWALFFFVGLILNFVCLLFLLLPRRPARASAARGVIRWLFDAWLKWMHFTGIVKVTWKGFEGPPLEAGTVYIANHPSLVDATFLLARLPDTICIFKPALMRNPAVGPAAVLADYVSGEAGVDVIRAAAERVADGRALLIFPEGTRTAPGTVLGPCRPGFALIAQRAQAAVQLVVVRSSPDLAARGRPLWPAPSVLPGWLEFSLDHRWDYEPERTAAELTARVERRLYEALRPPPA